MKPSTAEGLNIYPLSADTYPCSRKLNSGAVKLKNNISYPSLSTKTNCADFNSSNSYKDNWVIFTANRFNYLVYRTTSCSSNNNMCSCKSN